MKILAWNTPGLGNPSDILTLCELVMKEGPNVVFVQETKNFFLEFDNCLAMDSLGKNGWLAVF